MVKAFADKFEHAHEQLAKALLSCRAQTTPGEVHRLRKITRITEALLRKATEDYPGSQKLQKRIKKTAKELKRVRRCAGLLRDLDVHIKITKEMCDRAFKSAKPKMRSLLLREHESLDAKLRQQRNAAQNDLQYLLKKREIKIERALEKTVCALRSLHTRVQQPGMLATARGWVRQTPLPTNDPNDLHTYRKKTKAARYLAAMDKESASARKLEKRLKQTQDAIGEWHDLLLLGKEAKEILGAKAVINLTIKAARKKALNKTVRRIGLNQ